MQVFKNTLTVGLISMFACFSAEAITIDELGSAVVNGRVLRNAEAEPIVTAGEASRSSYVNALPIISGENGGIVAIQSGALPINYYVVPLAHIDFYNNLFGLAKKAHMPNPPVGVARDVNGSRIIVLRGEDLNIRADGYIDVDEYPDIQYRIGTWPTWAKGYYKLKDNTQAFKWSSPVRLPANVKFIGLQDFVVQASAKRKD